MASKIPPNTLENPQRLAVIKELNIVDIPTIDALDRLTRLASKITKSPVSLVSIVEADRQYFASLLGLPEPYATAKETPLSHSFCQHVVTKNAPLIVTDARKTPLLKDNLAIRDLDVVAYLGMPLTTRDGVPLGSFCVIDHQPRHWTQDEIDIIKELAVSVMTEIELRVQIQAREDAEARLETVISNAPIILYALDENGRFTLSEGRGLKALGRAPNEVVGTSVFDLYADNPSILQAIQEAYNGKPSRSTVFVDDIAYDAWYQPLFDHTGQVNGVVGVAHDITERKQAENALQRSLEELAQAHKEALAANQFKSQILARVSHELKTPLGAILGYSQLLQQNYYGEINQEQHGILDEVVESTGYLNQLVSELLEQSQLESGQLRLSPTPIVLKDLLGNITKRLNVLASNKGIGLTLNIMADPWPAIINDYGRLEQVIINLVSNAIKFTEQGIVSIDARPIDQQKWQLTVSDTGMGIPANAQERVFEPFWQVDGTISREKGGTGLGLAITKQIIELMGGQITLTSQIDQGSKFIVELPVAIGKVNNE